MILYDICLSLTYFIYYDKLHVHPCCCKWLHFVLFNDLVVFHVVFIHSSVGGHLGCFHVLAIVNGTPLNTGSRASFLIRVFFFSGHMARSGIVGSHGNSIFSFLRNFHIVLHSTIVVLIYYSHQQCRRVSFAPQLLTFVILITICCSVFLYRTVCASWTWVTISFPRLGKFSAIISSSCIFSGPFSLSHPFQFSRSVLSDSLQPH